MNATNVRGRLHEPDAGWKLTRSAACLSNSVLSVSVCYVLCLSIYVFMCFVYVFLFLSVCLSVSEWFLSFFCLFLSVSVPWVPGDGVAWAGDVRQFPCQRKQLDEVTWLGHAPYVLYGVKYIDPVSLVRGSSSKKTTSVNHTNIFVEYICVRSRTVPYNIALLFKWCKIYRCRGS